MLITILLSHLLLTTHAQSLPTVAPQEKQFLQTLYNRLDGRAWNPQTNWNRGDPCLNKWAGIKCRKDLATGRSTIVEISLGHNQLRGRLPEFYDEELLEARNEARYSALIHMQTQLPPELIQKQIREYLGRTAEPMVPNLRKLDLGYNEITGPLPSSVGLLTKLKHLTLTSNIIGSRIPPSIGRLGALRVLDLSENELSGSIPPEITQLRNLTLIDLQDNHIRSALPADIGNLRRLRTLSLDKNQMFGLLPASFSKLSELKFLYLNENQFFGPLPDISAMPNLIVLNVAQNLFDLAIHPSIQDRLDNGPRLRFVRN